MLEFFAPITLAALAAGGEGGGGACQPRRDPCPRSPPHTGPRYLTSASRSTVALTISDFRAFFFLFGCLVAVLDHCLVAVSDRFRARLTLCGPAAGGAAAAGHGAGAGRAAPPRRARGPPRRPPPPPPPPRRRPRPRPGSVRRRRRRRLPWPACAAALSAEGSVPGQVPCARFRTLEGGLLIVHREPRDPCPARFRAPPLPPAVACVRCRSQCPRRRAAPRVFRRGGRAGRVRGEGSRDERWLSRPAR